VHSRSVEGEKPIKGGILHSGGIFKRGSSLDGSPPFYARSALHPLHISLSQQSSSKLNALSVAQLTTDQRLEKAGRGSWGERSFHLVNFIVPSTEAPVLFAYVTLDKFIFSSSSSEMGILWISRLGMDSSMSHVELETLVCGKRGLPRSDCQSERSCRSIDCHVYSVNLWLRKFTHFYTIYDWI